MQHHEHAKQKLRDELHAQFSADLDQQVTAHAQETQQARLVAQLHGSIVVIGTPSQQLSHIHKNLLIKSLFCVVPASCRYMNSLMRNGVFIKLKVIFERIVLFPKIMANVY